MTKHTTEPRFFPKGIPVDDRSGTLSRVELADCFSNLASAKSEDTGILIFLTDGENTPPPVESVRVILLDDPKDAK